MDALIHETIFKMCAHDWGQPDSAPTSWVESPRWVCAKCGCGKWGCMYGVPPEYSTEIGRAWLILSKMQGMLLSIAAQPDGFWIVSFAKALNPKEDGTSDGYDETMPETAVQVQDPAHGICLLALDDENLMAEYLIHCDGGESHQPILR